MIGLNSSSLNFLSTVEMQVACRASKLFGTIVLLYLFFPTFFAGGFLDHFFVKFHACEECVARASRASRRPFTVSHDFKNAWVVIRMFFLGRLECRLAFLF